MDPLHGPQLIFSDRLHQDKYRLENEDFRESCNRVAYALKDDANHFHEFREVMLGMRFLPAGRITAAMGAPKTVTPYNCFVSGTIEDSFVSGDGSIMQRVSEAAATMRMGGGIGYDFSTLRPKGEIIRGVQSVTDGPLAFMPIFNAVCTATSSAGNRRGAMMGVMRVDHPDVEAFVHIKNEQQKLTGFNLSVAVTDEFMEHLATGQAFPLRWGGRTYREVDPHALWEMIMRSTWDWAEPGVLFIDTINRMNNLYYCEKIAATNPCGEQPLPPFGACLLGSFNLVRYMNYHLDEGVYYFDFDLLRRDVAPVARAMDNVVDRATYPLPQQRIEALSKRRMGIGVTGLANAAEAIGHPYGSPGFIEFELTVLEFLRDELYVQSARLAAEKGTFPAYHEELWLAGEYARSLPERVREEVRRHGIRNSHLTSIAPTGTISLCADNVSSGVEPVLAYEEERTVIMPDGPETVEVSDYGFREFGVRGKLCGEVTATEHIDVLSAASAVVDSSVSKTCNVDHRMPWDEFKALYWQAWERGCKGCTTFNADGKRFAIRRAKVTDEAVGCEWDPKSGKRECG